MIFDKLHRILYINWQIKEWDFRIFNALMLKSFISLWTKFDV